MSSFYEILKDLVETDARCFRNKKWEKNFFGMLHIIKPCHFITLFFDPDNAKENDYPFVVKEWSPSIKEMQSNDWIVYKKTPIELMAKYYSDENA